jgi:O-antigen/teichoic acid export membrane protein
MPLLYFVNFLWTINFARGNLKLVFKIMAVSFAVNIISCSILIPLYKNEGAAVAYFITALVQLILYLQKKTLNISLKRVYLLIFWPLTSIICGFIAFRYTTHPALRISIAIFLYLAVVFMSKQVRIKDWKTLRSLYQ